MVAKTDLPWGFIIYYQANQNYFNQQIFLTLTECYKLATEDTQIRENI
jgi:hypothetical protein